MKTDTKLPIDPFLPGIVKSLKSQNRLIIQASPGAGKSTKVPLALPGRIIMLQPRRIAARSVAMRMSYLLGEPLGKTVGYHIRHERRVSKQTRILVITEGMLARYLVSDPFLEKTDTIILDEFHERSIHSDLALAMIKSIQAIREDLKLIVMSATLDVVKLSAYLEQAPVIEVPHRQHPLSIHYQPRNLRLPIEESVLTAVQKIHSQPFAGDILVFLAGAREIQDCVSTLKSRMKDFEIIPFFSALKPHEQDLVFKRGSKPRVICATNIAETSLTIPGITTVIDSGWCKIEEFEPATGIATLKQIRISQASAEQRAGRAGRLGPGSVIRLWSTEDHASRKSFEVPEIMRSDFSSALLSVVNHHGSDLKSFPFYETPPQVNIKHAKELMTLLKALSTTGNLTPLGKKMLNLPLSPRNAAILVQAGRDIHTACLLCALLDNGPLMRGDKLDISLLDQLHLLQNPHGDRWSRQFSPTAQALRSIRETTDQLTHQTRNLWPNSGELKDLPSDEKELIPLIMAGYPDRLCVLREDGEKGIMATGRHVMFRVPVKKEYALAIGMDSGFKGGTQNQMVSMALGLNWGILQKVGSGNLKKELNTWFDDEKKQVITREEWKYGKTLSVRLGSYTEAPREVNAEILADYILENFEKSFNPCSKAENLMWRLRFAIKHMPEEKWPDVSVEGIKNTVPSVCERICTRHAPKLEYFINFDWSNYWMGLLDWKLKKKLEAEAPGKIETITGKVAYINYAPDFGVEGRPVLSCILQHLFGMSDVPVLAKGKVKPLIHILGPNRRPVQVTSDLTGFWRGSYQQVRKELKGRYPKHAWPEKPPGNF